MAGIGGTISIEHKSRLCEAEGRVGYFHYWEQYADVISPGLTIGSHPGGQYSRVFGIVEFADGVERVDISKIKFIDSEHEFLNGLEGNRNVLG